MSDPDLYDVADFGAQGNGIAVDSPAINAAIDAASAAGGGKVVLRPGTYLCFTVRLRSHVCLHLEAGSTLLAATPSPTLGSYDPPEPNPWGDELQYQDFGHSHWRNSLIWGAGLTDISITGPGVIDGRGLLRDLTYSSGEVDLGPNGTASAQTPGAVTPGRGDPATPFFGQANKAIGLVNCQRVTLSDFWIHRGGHFAVLATGIDHLTIFSLSIDTNRDGLDLDCCRDVTITGCTVNSPNDDAIVLKSSYALGERRSSERIHISDCTVSGFDVGTVINGTFGRTTRQAPDLDGPTGRIKIGTESNGDFRHIKITHCTFIRSRGLALESVDGAHLEYVEASHLSMRELTSAPVFLRLGNRARGPVGTQVGRIRHIYLRDIVVSDGDGRFPITIAGLREQPIEDVTIEAMDVVSAGGVTLEDAALQPSALINQFFHPISAQSSPARRDPFAVPQCDKGYPEPSMFGLLPASALFARHVHGLVVRMVTHQVIAADTRPAIMLDNVHAAKFVSFSAPREDAAPNFLREVTDLQGLPQT